MQHDPYEIERRVLRIVDTECNGPRITVAPETRLLSDLKLDSMDLFDLTCYLQDEFTIEIEDAEMQNVATIAGLVSLVRRKVEPC